MQESSAPTRGILLHASVKSTPFCDRAPLTLRVCMCAACAQRVLPAILDGLADESDGVRDAALTAGACGWPALQRSLARFPRPLLCWPSPLGPSLSLQALSGVSVCGVRAAYPPHTTMPPLTLCARRLPSPHDHATPSPSVCAPPPHERATAAPFAFCVACRRRVLASAPLAHRRGCRFPASPLTPWAPMRLKGRARLPWHMHGLLIDRRLFTARRSQLLVVPAPRPDCTTCRCAHTLQMLSRQRQSKTPHNVGTRT